MTIRSFARRYLPAALRALGRRIITYSRLRVFPRSELYRLPEIEHLRRFFKAYRIDCVFDVGANAGQYARMLRDDVKYRGLIFSFEPIPELAEQLRRKSARDQSWHIFELALSNAPGVASFNVMRSDQFSSLATPSHEEVADFVDANSVERTIELTTATLDEVYMDLSRIHPFSRPFLKMDTQGFDLAVARGGETVLPAFYGLQSELAVRRIYAESPTYSDAISYYQARGFELSAFVPNNAGHFPKLIEIDCIMFNRTKIAAGFGAEAS